jgi:hypothetical protein
VHPSSAIGGRLPPWGDARITLLCPANHSEGFSRGGYPQRIFFGKLASYPEIVDAWVSARTFNTFLAAYSGLNYLVLSFS